MLSILLSSGLKKNHQGVGASQITLSCLCLWSDNNQSLCWCLCPCYPRGLCKMLAVCAAAWSYVDVHGLCCPSRPYLCEWSMLPPVTVIISGPVLFQRAMPGSVVLLQLECLWPALPLTSKEVTFAVLLMTSDEHLIKRDMAFVTASTFHFSQK